MKGDYSKEISKSVPLDKKILFMIEHIEERHRIQKRQYDLPPIRAIF